MAGNKIKGNQVDTIDRDGPIIQESFDLDRLDNLSAGLGVQYTHYKCLPSPIGQKDRGDYRRSDGVDTITSNGMIYFKSGVFTATMTDNSRQRERGSAGVLDPSESKLVLPRFYDTDDTSSSDGKRIYLSPGDRIYVADPDAIVLVSNPQKMDYLPDEDNIPMFPIVELEVPILDSRNIQYVQDVDYAITRDGNIRWLQGGKNPGIDPDTGKGRIYSVRYLYKSYWYITTLLKEVRITNVTTDGVRSTERMPYHCVVQREYIYHNQNHGNKANQLKSKDPKRADAAPQESINPSKYTVPVDMSGIGEDEE